MLHGPDCRLCKNGEGGGVRADDHHFFADYRVCPLQQRVGEPEELEARRGLKAGELRVGWNRISTTLLGPDSLLDETSITIIVDDGVRSVVRQVPVEATFADLDAVPRGRDLDVAVALTRRGHVISDVGTLKLRYTQTRTGDRAPAQERGQTPSAIVTANTTNQLAAVKGLAATTPSTNADTDVDLTWNAPASSMNLANFRIQHCASSACSSPVPLASPAETATAHTATNLTRNTTYHFRIQAVADPNSTIGDSAWSATVSHTTAKTIVKIANFRVSKYASDNLELTWDLPANRATTVKRYILKQCPSANDCTTPTNTWETSTYETNVANPRNLQPNTDYYFTIEAELSDTVNQDDFEVPVSSIHTFRTTN